MTLAPQSRSLRGVYGISVMSELSGVGPQTLRLYERRGLLTPTRTSGGTRRYSESDLATLGRITALIEDGVNLTGVRLILALEAENAALAAQINQSIDGQP
ncbi:MerR family transcriptional regulator [Rhodococcus kronopolitis]|uniref:MerR family transcriptional regulator n=1 Tax=Rhodococcus kronopolitis TaxID=1460226 RepID=A0ABV9FSC0_9NOCA